MAGRSATASLSVPIPPCRRSRRAYLQSAARPVRKCTPRPKVKEDRTMSITRDQIAAVRGPIDNALAAELAAADPSPEELAEAWAWVNSDEALVNEGRRLPSGKIAELVDILAPPLDEDA